MRQLILLPIVALLASACSRTTCEDVDCLYRPTTTLHLVDDGSGQPVGLPYEGYLPPVFTIDHHNLGDLCTSQPDGGVCTAWQFQIYGEQTIHIELPGYQPVDVPINVHSDTTGCCPGPIDPVEMTIRLKKA